MTKDPIKAIAEAVRHADANRDNAWMLAGDIRDALTTDAVTQHAADRLAEQIPGWLDLDATIGELVGNKQALAGLARTVLGSVGDVR